MDKIGQRLKEFHESYSEGSERRYMVASPNVASLMHWAWKEAQKTLLAEWNKDLFHDGFVDSVELTKKDFLEKFKEIEGKK